REPPRRLATKRSNTATAPNYERRWGSGTSTNSPPRETRWAPTSRPVSPPSSPKVGGVVWPASPTTQFATRRREPCTVRPRLTAQGDSVVTDIAASLPHQFAEGGLRRLAGLDYDTVRNSALRNMHGLFDDDRRLGPSLQAQLFAYTGLGALAALPIPLSELLSDPFDFRVAAATAFSGMDSLGELRAAKELDYLSDTLKDKFAMRLAASLAS